MDQRLFAKLDELRSCIGFLEMYKSRSENEVLEDETLRGAIERFLGVAIDCTLDISEIISDMEGLEKTESHEQIMLMLGQAGVLEEDIALRLSYSSVFWDMLVHHRSMVEPGDVYFHLQEGTEDFKEFIRSVEEYLISLPEDAWKDEAQEEEETGEEDTEPEEEAAEPD